jgi:hypothetical protein
MAIVLRTEPTAKAVSVPPEIRPYGGIAMNAG